MFTDDAPHASRALKELESPLDEIRLAALTALAKTPTLAALRAAKTLAAADPSPAIRFEARRFLSTLSEKLTPRELAAADMGQPDRLRALVADPDPAVRAKVIRWLALLRDAAVPQILSALLVRESDPFVLCTLLQALAIAEGPKAVEKILPHLLSPDPRLRSTAVEALEATGDPAILPRLIPCLADPHHRVRVAAARVLQAQERERVLACLDQMLDSSSEIAVRSAHYVLRFFDEAPAMARLPAGLRSPWDTVRQMARASLAYAASRGSTEAARLLQSGAAAEAQAPEDSHDLEATHPTPVDAILEERLTSPRPDERVTALRDAVRFDRVDLAESIAAALPAEPEARVIATQLAALGRLGSLRQLSAVSAYLSHAEPRIRANAVEAVGRLDPANSPSLLASFLEDPNNRVRANAAVALLAHPATGAEDVLAAMAHSANPRFRMSAIWGAAQCASPRMVALLEQLLRSDDSDTARRARAALEALAQAIPEAAAALKGARREEPVEAAGVPPERIRKLLFDLEHESAAVRLATIQTIAGSRDRRLLEALVSRLRDDDATVRHAAGEAARAMLRDLPAGAGGAAALDDWRRQLEGDDTAAMASLEDFLERVIACGSRAAAELLVSRLPGENRAAVRARLLSVVALLGDSGAVPMVRALLRDPDARVRSNAVDVLDALGGEGDWLAAVTCLADPEPRVRAAAIRVCLRISQDRFLAYLRGMLCGPVLAERAAALFVVRTARVPDRVGLLKAHFVLETNPRLFEEGADALAREMRAGRARDVLAFVADLPEGAKRQCLREAIQAQTAALSRSAQAEPIAGDAPPGAAASPADDAPAAAPIALEPETVSREQLEAALASEREPYVLAGLLDAARKRGLLLDIEAVQPLTRAKDRRIRLSALAVMALQDTPQTRECLAGLVRDRDVQVSQGAFGELRRMSWDAAAGALSALASAGRPWASRRALELLEGADDPAGLPLLLETLGRGIHPSLLELATRLVLRWGDPTVVERLAELYTQAPASDRPFLGEVAGALAAHLGMPPEPLADRIRAAGPPREAGPGLVESGVHPAALAPAERPPLVSRLGPLAAVLFYFGLLGGGWWIFWPEELAATIRKSRGADDAPEPAARSRAIVIPAREAPRRAPAIGGASSFGAMLDEALEANVVPTLEVVEARLTQSLARSGIRSKTLIRVAALQRVEHGHLRGLREARQALDGNDAPRAVARLEETLALLDPEHLLARADVLRALEAALRQAGRSQDALARRAELDLLDHKLVEISLEAAREGGQQPAEARAELDAFEKRQTMRVEAAKGRDFLESKP